MVLLEIPCSWRTFSINSWAVSGAVVVWEQGMKWAILLSRSPNTRMLECPRAGGRSVLKKNSEQHTMLYVRTGLAVVVVEGDLAVWCMGLGVSANLAGVNVFPNMLTKLGTPETVEDQAGSFGNTKMPCKQSHGTFWKSWSSPSRIYRHCLCQGAHHEAEHLIRWMFQVLKSHWTWKMNES